MLAANTPAMKPESEEAIKVPSLKRYRRVSFEMKSSDALMKKKVG